VGRHARPASGLRAPLRAFLDPGLEPFHHFGYALGALFRSAFGGVDPPQVRAAVELCEGVEERSSVRFGHERFGDVFGEVVTLRPFWCDLHRDLVTDGDAAAAGRGRTKG